MNPRALALAAAAALGAAACGPGFDPPSLLLGLRVLGVRSEPVTPAAGESTTISALVYAPPGGAPVTYAWSWCPFPGSASDGYPCLVSEAELAELTGGASVPPYDLGDAETATFDHTIDPALLEAVCTGMPGQPSAVDCTTGFPIQIKLTVTSGTQTVTAVKRLRLRFDDTHEPNVNPIVGELDAVVGGATVILGDPPGPTLLRRVEATVHVDVPPESSETFTGTDDRGEPAQEKERLIVSWFVETGSVADDITAFIDGRTPLATALENTWEPDGAEDYAPSTAELIVVVRDSRDGTTWTRGTVTLGAEP